MHVKHRGLVVLAHQLGDALDKLWLERHGLLDVAFVVVDDGAVQAPSRELLDAELLDQTAVK